jgi:hypothetical protein
VLELVGHEARQRCITLVQMLEERRQVRFNHRIQRRLFRTVTAVEMRVAYSHQRQTLAEYSERSRPLMSPIVIVQRLL